MKIDSTIQMLDIPLRFFSSFCAFTSEILAVRVVLFSFIYKHPSTVTSVVDPWHFGTDPDPRIRASDQWIRILLFSSLTFKTLITGT